MSRSSDGRSLLARQRQLEISRSLTVGLEELGATYGRTNIALEFSLDLYMLESETGMDFLLQLQYLPQSYALMLQRGIPPRRQPSDRIGPCVRDS